MMIKKVIYFEDTHSGKSTVCYGSHGLSEFLDLPKEEFMSFHGYVKFPEATMISGTE